MLDRTKTAVVVWEDWTLEGKQQLAREGMEFAKAVQVDWEGHCVSRADGAYVFFDRDDHGEAKDFRELVAQMRLYWEPYTIAQLFRAMADAHPYRTVMEREF